MRTLVRATAWLLLVCSLSAAPVLAWQAAPAVSVSSHLLDAVPMRLIGPTAPSGRVWQVAGVPSEPKTFYVCTAQAGVWRTTNHGTTMERVFAEDGASSCGAVAVAPSDPHQIWVGTGEPAARQSVGLGRGVFKSVDGGVTWQSVGLENTEEIAAIDIDPRDPGTVLVAATGHLWGRNPERGVYRTGDGGRTWTRVLFVDDQTGAIDLVRDPFDPDILYASMWQRMRTGGSQMRESGPGSGIFKSEDGGLTWRRLTQGLPTDDLSKITLAVGHHAAGLVYAFVMAGEPQSPGRTVDSGGIFRSDDGGGHWERVSDKIASRTYYTHLKIDPNDDQRLWILDLGLWRSDDGGRNWVEHNTRHVHADLHGFWIDPSDSENLVLGGDGGVSTSMDGGASWVQTVLPLAQFYAVDVDDQEPYGVYGGMQDTGSWIGWSQTRDVEGITTHDWIKVRATGDGMAIHPDPRDPNIIFMVQNNGNTSRLDLHSWTRTEMQPTQEWAAEQGLGRLRWDWTAPLILDADDPDVFYLAANYVFRCAITAAHPEGDVDHTCSPISGDLTAQQDTPFDGVDGAYHSYGALFSIAQSPVDTDVLWAGADDGPIHVSRDRGRSWTRVDAGLPTGAPTQAVVSKIEPSRAGAGIAYVALDTHYRDGKRPHLYRTENFGGAWTEITSDLPEWGVTYVILEDPHNPNVLYLGTETGLFVSIDRGTHWLRWRSNLPTTAVRSLAIQARDRELVVGTFGQAIWVADIAPIEQLAEALTHESFLFDVKPTVAYNLRHTYGITIEELNGDVFFRGENPPYGAAIFYYLGTSLAGPAKLEISDASGDVIRTMEGRDGPGLHQVTWDLEPDPGRLAPRDPTVHTAPELQRRRRVAPGLYTVTLHAGSVSLSREIMVRAEADGRSWVVPR